MKADRKN